jgi:hypothetical protein
MSRAEAERLLDSGAGGPHGLSDLIAAAAPPVAPGELPGERAALANFRAAHLTPVSSRRRIPLLKTAFANLVAAKIAAATAVAAAAAGGVALAAATGNLPGPLQHAAHAAFNAPAAQPSHPAPSGSDDPSEAAPSSPEAEASGRPSDAGTPSPSLTGLCKAFQAGATDNPGKALTNPAFSVLVATAGGKDNVAAYCVTLVGPAPTHPGGAPSTHPSSHRSSHPTHPAGAPRSHPAGPPSDLPTHP